MFYRGTADEPLSTLSVPRSTPRSEIQVSPLPRVTRQHTMVRGTKYTIMTLKFIIAVTLGLTMLSLQACFFPSDGSSSPPEYRYSPGYQYNQPEYSQQQYGEYGQFPAYRDSPVPANPRSESSTPGKPFERNPQYAAQHALCDAYGNNCIVCDADNDRCRRQPSN